MGFLAHMDAKRDVVGGTHLSTAAPLEQLVLKYKPAANCLLLRLALHTSSQAFSAQLIRIQELDSRHQMVVDLFNKKPGLEDWDTLLKTILRSSTMSALHHRARSSLAS